MTRILNVTSEAMKDLVHQKRQNILKRSMCTVLYKNIQQCVFRNHSLKYKVRSVKMSTIKRVRELGYALRS